MGTVLPRLGSGCERFGALQDWADFIASLHSLLEKANLFQKNAVGNNRQYHSQISSTQQNNFFFLSASIYSLHYHFSQSSSTWRAVCWGCICSPGAGVALARVALRCFCRLTWIRGTWKGCQHQTRGNWGLPQASACSKWLFIILIPHTFVSSVLWFLSLTKLNALVYLLNAAGIPTVHFGANGTIIISGFN